MTMASRDIANMHLFLDLKKKFPDLPDETLRRYVPLYAENQKQCINDLQKECENHYHPSQPFSDFRLPESKVNSSINDYAKNFIGHPNDCLIPLGVIQHSELPTVNKILPVASGRSKSHAGVVSLAGKTIISANPPSKPNTAPVITSSNKPFTELYKQIPISSHPTECQVPNDRNNQMIFSTTKQFIIEPPVTQESKAFIPISGESDCSRKSGVKLSITPSFPFQQQQVNVFNTPVCATSSVSRPAGHHTTSLSFQLQPQSSSEFPLEISTIPTSIGSPSNFRNFGSHVQVSVTPQTMTFTALRLQHPSFSLAQNASHIAGAEGGSNEHKRPPSHAHNSSSYLFPSTTFQQSVETKDVDQSSNFVWNNASQTRPVQSYELSPDYILAVKNEQISQLDLLLRELEKEKAICVQLKAEVNKKEQEVVRKAATKSSFPSADELQKLKEEIRNLRIECNCLSKEVDSAGQIPLGVTDEKIYSEIFPGPNEDDIAKANLKDPAEAMPSFEDEENDENNSWKCEKCTFKNHPALDKCELCELPKNSGFFFDDN